MDELEYFKNNLLNGCLENVSRAENFCIEFIKRFPRENIKTMTMKDYLFAPKGYGQENSFCCQLMYSPLASMGDNRPNIFGVYLKNGTNMSLSRTFESYGDDFWGAFDFIKEEISNVLDSAEMEDFAAIEESKLNSAFKQILIATYFPEKYMPAPAKDTLNAYCNALGFIFPKETGMSEKNNTVVRWMKTSPAFDGWSTSLLMNFCDWLWRSHRTIDGKSYTKDSIITKAKKIDAEIEHFQLEGNDKEAVVKVRVNQTVFRTQLLGRYGKCCICGVSSPELLVASHIKPWAVSEPEEKLDVDNGFLLCPNHDRLFDQGLITFDDDGGILISKRLSTVDQLFMNVRDGMKIGLNEKNKKYLKYHRSYIWKKE